MKETHRLTDSRTRTAARAALVLAAAALIQLSSPAGAQGKQATIKSLSVSAQEEATTLTLTTSRKLEWTANWLSAGELRLTFPEVTAKDEVVDLAPEQGLVASVTVVRSAEDEPALTTLQVSLTRPAGYSAEVRKKRIEFDFVPRDEPEPQLPAPTTASTSGPSSELPAPAAEPGTAAAAAPTAAGGSEESGEYRIGPGDLLQISVFGLDEFDRTVRVLRDGSIYLPLIGGVELANMTLPNAESTIAALLAERRLVNNPQVSLFVQEYVSRGVSVQGAVEEPGVYQMIQQRTLLEILGEAGGLSGRENERAGQQIFIIRQLPDGQQQRIEIDAERLLNQGLADLNIPLVPGDVILVPFAQRHRVYVSGAVVEPGAVDYLSTEGITVLQAITAAGGVTERGNLGNVAIVRRLADGSEVRISVNAKKIRKGKQEDVPLVRNDTVIVGEWFF